MFLFTRLLLVIFINNILIGVRAADDRRPLLPLKWNIKRPRTTVFQGHGGKNQDDHFNRPLNFNERNAVQCQQGDVITSNTAQRCEPWQWVDSNKEYYSTSNHQWEPSVNANENYPGSNNIIEPSSYAYENYAGLNTLIEPSNYAYENYAGSNNLIEPSAFANENYPGSNNLIEPSNYAYENYAGSNNQIEPSNNVYENYPNSNNLIGPSNYAFENHADSNNFIEPSIFAYENYHGLQNTADSSNFERPNIVNPFSPSLERSSNYLRNPNSYSVKVDAGPTYNNQAGLLQYSGNVFPPNVQDLQAEQQAREDQELCDFVESLLCDPYEAEEDNMLAETNPSVLSPRIHKLVRVDGLCKKTRKKCFECNQKHKQTNYQFCSQTNIKKVNTKCEICNKYLCANCFKDLHKLDSIPIMSTTPKPITDQSCFFCKKIIGRDEDQLIEHSWTCNKIPRKNKGWFGCYGCGHNFRKRNAIAEHIRSHTGVRPFQCTNCPYAGANQIQLTRHFRLHSEERSYKCHLCDTYAAKTKGNLNTHLKTKHKVS